MKCQQRLAHRLGHKPADFAFPMKLHLAFGRMDIDVHSRGIDFQKQAAHRIAAFHQRSVVPFE